MKNKKIISNSDPIPFGSEIKLKAEIEPEINPETDSNPNANSGTFYFPMTSKKTQ